MIETPLRSNLEDSGYISRGNSTKRDDQDSRRHSNPQAFTKASFSQTLTLKKAASSNAVFSQLRAGSQPKIAKQHPSPGKTDGLGATWQVKSTMEEEFWDENDKSFEFAMSQMEIPDPPSSQQGGRSQSTSALNLPAPAARLSQTAAGPTEGKWEGFRSRDKRSREKSSDSSAASAGKLSSKPLEAVRPDNQRALVTTVGTAILSTSTSNTPLVRTLSKSNSVSTEKAVTSNPVTRPAMAPSRSFSSTSMNGAGLAKKFKCPTITNTAAAKAEQDKKAAAAAKLVKRAGQPLPPDEAWMEEVDFDDSF